MERLFLRIEGGIKEVADIIYPAVGMLNYSFGESLRVPNGIYATASFLGIELVLLENGYDHENDYSFVLVIDGDVLLKIESENNIRDIAKTAADVLSQKLNIKVALEKDDKLFIYGNDENVE